MEGRGFSTKIGGLWRGSGGKGFLDPSLPADNLVWGEAIISNAMLYF